MVKMLFKLSCSLGLLAYGVSGEGAAAVAAADATPEAAAPPPPDVEAEAVHDQVDQSPPSSNIKSRLTAYRNKLKRKALRDRAADDYLRNRLARYDAEDEAPYYYDEAPRYDYQPRVRGGRAGLTPEEYAEAIAAKYAYAYDRDMYGDYARYNPYVDGASYGGYPADPYYYGYEPDYSCDSYYFWFSVLALACRLTFWACVVVLGYIAYQKWNKKIVPWLKSRNEAHETTDVELAGHGRDEILLQQQH